MPALLPGRYRLEVEKQGFKAVTRSGIVLEVNQVARVDISMARGAVSERIEVTAAPPLVEAGTSSLGQVIRTEGCQRTSTKWAEFCTTGDPRPRSFRCGLRL